jgi:hypothetical protein
VDLDFASRVIEWRGPAPYYFVPVPDEECADIREVAAMATSGWGVLPVEARIGEIAFETSLIPKDGGISFRSRTLCASRTASRQVTP